MPSATHRAYSHIGTCAIKQNNNIINKFNWVWNDMKKGLSRSQRRWGTRRKIKIRPGESRHHRKPVSRGGVNDEYNISIVDQKLHDHWHALFSNYTPQTIAAIISEKWIDPAFKFVCVVR